MLHNKSSLRDTIIHPKPDEPAPGYVAWSFSGESELIGTHRIELAWEEKINKLVLRWPSGFVQDLGSVAAVDRTLVVDETNGIR